MTTEYTFEQNGITVYGECGEDPEGNLPAYINIYLDGLPTTVGAEKMPVSLDVFKAAALAHIAECAAYYSNPVNFANYGDDEKETLALLRRILGE